MGLSCHLLEKGMAWVGGGRHVAEDDADLQKKRYGTTLIG